MEQQFQRSFFARWGDMDFNGHMKNTAYLDVSGDVRMLYFAEQGFSMREFERLKIGPVIMKDELQYLREVRLLETFNVNLLLAGLSEDHSRFLFRNEFLREDGKRIAQVNSLGGWLDLNARKLSPPPTELIQVLQALKKSDDFQILSANAR